jgi:hypothetical protein
MLLWMCTLNKSTGESMDSVQQANDLVKAVNADIQRIRGEVATQMVKEGKHPPEWVIADNMEEFIDHPELGYQCWPMLSPSKFTRAQNN